jgi:hypothetical protein
MTDYTSIRIARSTLDALNAVRESYLRAYDRGQIILEQDARGRVSLEQVILRLIAEREDHAARRARSRRKRKSSD